jgi:hypothetical protein
MVEATVEYWKALVSELKSELEKEKLRASRLEMELDLARSKLMVKE